MGKNHIKSLLEMGQEYETYSAHALSQTALNSGRLHAWIAEVNIMLESMVQQDGEPSVVAKYIPFTTKEISDSLEYFTSLLDLKIIDRQQLLKTKTNTVKPKHEGNVVMLVNNYNPAKFEQNEEHIKNLVIATLLINKELKKRP